MSRTKDLQTLPENNINLFKLFSKLVPENKSKYTETLLRIVKKTPGLDGHLSDVKSRLETELGLSEISLNGLTTMEMLFLYRILEMFNFSDLKSFIKFCELNERGLIKQNDLSRYDSFDEILNSLSLAEMVADHKELEKQVKVIFENDEWLLVRPLTYLSSNKYGSNTKWCTTTENNPEYFLKYSKRGVLIYCINKKTGYKVASFYSLDKNDPEFSFWNQKDNRVDSLDTELTDELRRVIYEESKGNGAKTNRFLLSDEERIKEEELLKKYYVDVKQVVMNQPVPVEERIGYIRRAAERAVEEIERPVEEVVSENYFLTTTSVPIYGETSNTIEGPNRA